MEGIPVEVDGFYSRHTLEEAITKNEKYDLIYLDIQMKNGVGFIVSKIFVIIIAYAGSMYWKNKNKLTIPTGYYFIPLDKSFNRR